MPTRKLWDHAIDIKEVFMPQKEKVYPLSREEREEVREFVKEQLRKRYIRLSKITTNSTGVLCREEGWKEEDGSGLPISE